jgi:hypothetical protein
MELVSWLVKVVIGRTMEYRIDTKRLLLFIPPITGIESGRVPERSRPRRIGKDDATDLFRERSLSDEEAEYGSLEEESIKYIEEDEHGFPLAFLNLLGFDCLLG